MNLQEGKHYWTEYSIPLESSRGLLDAEASHLTSHYPPHWEGGTSPGPWPLTVPRVSQRSHLTVPIRQGTDEACGMRMTAMTVLHVLRINEHHRGGWKSQKRQMHKKIPKSISQGKRVAGQPSWACPTFLSPKGGAWLRSDAGPLVGENQGAREPHCGPPEQSSPDLSLQRQPGAGILNSWPSLIPLPSSGEKRKTSQITALYYWWERMTGERATISRGSVPIIKLGWWKRDMHIGKKCNRERNFIFPSP